jgi:hypothetical protein
MDKRDIIVEKYKTLREYYWECRMLIEGIKEDFGDEIIHYAYIPPVECYEQDANYDNSYNTTIEISEFYDWLKESLKGKIKNDELQKEAEKLLHFARKKLKPIFFTFEEIRELYDYPLYDYNSLYNDQTKYYFI